MVVQAVIPFVVEPMTIESSIVLAWIPSMAATELIRFCGVPLRVIHFVPYFPPDRIGGALAAYAA